MTTIYSTQATAIGGRSGSASSIDGALRLALTKPVALGGRGSLGTNPEQLFAAAHSASFLDALLSAARSQGIALAADSNVTAKVHLSTGDDGHWRLEVVLVPDLPHLAPTQLASLLRSAALQCPYTLALQGRGVVRINPL
jgi:lipoyl-dependent peroxiredoxin